MAKFRLFEQYRGLRKELYVLTFGRMMTNLGSMIFPIFTLILSQKLGFNAQTIAIFWMVYSLVSIPISLLGGKLADSFNKKYIIIICDLVSVAAFIYCFFAEINIVNIFIFTGASLFQSIEWPAYDALIADFTTSKDRERAYSLSYLGANLGLVLAPTIGGLLFNNYLNLAFLINGVSILLSTIMIFMFVKDLSKEKDTSQASEYEQDIDSKSNTFVYIFKNRVVLVYIFISILASFTYAMYNYLMPLDLTTAYGDEGSVVFGTMSSVNCIVVVVFTGIITRLFRRIYDVDKFYFGEILKMLGYILFFILIKNVVICYVAIVVFTYGEIFNTLASSPFLTRRIPATHRGRVMAVSNVVVSLAVSGMQIGVGAVYDSPNLGRYFAWGIVVGAGVLTCALITIIRIFDKKDHPLLYYRKVLEDGTVLSIRRTNLRDLNDYYKEFEMDEALFEDPNQMKTYVYSEDTVKKYWNKIRKEKHRENFIIFLDEDPIGEITLKKIVYNVDCEVSIHLKNDSVKNKGYGYISEKLIVDYAFNRLNMKKVKADSILKNTRSQHVLEKVGFTKVSNDDRFVYYEICRN